MIKNPTLGQKNLQLFLKDIFYSKMIITLQDRDKKYVFLPFVSSLGGQMVVLLLHTWFLDAFVLLGSKSSLHSLDQRYNTNSPSCSSFFSSRKSLYAAGVSDIPSISSALNFNVGFKLKIIELGILYKLIG